MKNSQRGQCLKELTETGTNSQEKEKENHTRRGGLLNLYILCCHIQEQPLHLFLLHIFSSIISLYNIHAFILFIRKSNDSSAKSVEYQTEAFTKHLTTLFQPFPSKVDAEEEEEIISFLEARFQMSLPIKSRKQTKLKI